MIIDKSKEIFRITITLEHLSDLISYMYDLKELGIIDKNVGSAWTCSLFDLMVFSEIIENEDNLIEYLEKRLAFYDRPELNFKDELDLLGYFLEERLVFDEEMLSKLTHFNLNKYSADIDEYFEGRGQKQKEREKGAYEIEFVDELKGVIFIGLKKTIAQI